MFAPPQAYVTETMKIPSSIKNPLDILPLILMVVGHAILVARLPQAIDSAIFWLTTTCALIMVYTIQRGRFQLHVDRTSRLAIYAVPAALIVVGFAVRAGLLSGAIFTPLEILTPLAWSGLFSLYFVHGEKLDNTMSKLPAYFAAMISGIAFCVVIWDMRGYQYAMAHHSFHRFPYTFEIWENNPITSHWFLTFDNRWSQFEAKKFYHGYTPPFLFIYYIPLKVIKWFSGLNYEYSIRFSPFINGVLYSLILPAVMVRSFSCDPKAKARFLLLIVSSVVVTLSIPDLWTGTLLFDADNVFPLTALFQFVAASAIIGVTSHNSRKSVLSAYIILGAFGILAPIGAAFFGCALLIYSLVEDRSPLLRLALFSIAVGVSSYVGIQLLGKLAGLQSIGSSFVERSGLNGNAQMFSNSISAFFSTTIQAQARAYSFFIGGTIAWTIAFGLQFFVERVARVHVAVFLLFAPVLLDLFVFPQSHAVHPYLYDILTSVLGFLSFVFVIQALQGNERYAPERWFPLVMAIFCGVVLHNYVCIVRFFAST